MRVNKKFKNKFNFSVLIFLILGLLGLAAIVIYTSIQIDRNKNYIETEAVVVDTIGIYRNGADGWSWYYYPVYEFTTTQGEVIQLVAEEYDFQRSVGTHWTIYYHKDNPRKLSYIEYRYTFLIILGPIFFIGGILPILAESGLLGGKGMKYIDNYYIWKRGAKDEKTQSELESIKDNTDEWKERFTNELVFGTAGLRGIMGAGTAYMNIYTVARVTEGLALYMRDTGGKSVAISFDTRNNSKLFADTARNVLEHFGISTYIFSEPHPVPLLSYAVRHFGADFGIMITASHNPKEYNGYKLYDNLGGQLTDEASAVIAKHIDKAQYFNEYLSAKPTESVDSEVQENYNRDIERYFGWMKDVKKSGSVVYTSIHGSGLYHVKALFDRFNIEYSIVEKQADFDGDFPTVKSPNPENKEALTMAIEEARKCGAEAVIATDPDADRMAAAVKGRDGKFFCLDGNQTGALMLDFLLESFGDDFTAAAVLKSFVSTNLVDRIAAKYKGVDVFEVGVGFKNQAEKIREFETTFEHDFFFGFEESCGYLIHDFCRDKDGVSAALLFAVMAGYYKAQGKSVCERLEELYREHGYYIDRSVSAYYEGLDGFVVMQKIMERLFERVPDSIGGKKVLVSRDYKREHNSVYYELDGGSFVCARPSGTEPKLKYYICATAATREEAQQLFDAIQKDMECLTRP